MRTVIKQDDFYHRKAMWAHKNRVLESTLSYLRQPERLVVRLALHLLLFLRGKSFNTASQQHLILTTKMKKATPLRIPNFRGL